MGGKRGDIGEEASQVYRTVTVAGEDWSLTQRKLTSDPDCPAEPSADRRKNGAGATKVKAGKASCYLVWSFFSLCGQDESHGEAGPGPSPSHTHTSYACLGQSMRVCVRCFVCVRACICVIGEGRKKKKRPSERKSGGDGVWWWWGLRGSPVTKFGLSVGRMQGGSCCLCGRSCPLISN